MAASGSVDKPVSVSEFICGGWPFNNRGANSAPFFSGAVARGAGLQKLSQRVVALLDDLNIFYRLWFSVAHAAGLHEHIKHLSSSPSNITWPPHFLQL